MTASAVGAAVGARADEYLGGNNALAGVFKGSDLARSSAVGFAADIATAVARGGTIEIARIATDAFGNALGNSLTATMLSASNAGDRVAGGVKRPVSKLAAERAQYGGMTQREVLGGGKDCLTLLGPYTGELNRHHSSRHKKAPEIRGSGRL